MIEKFTFFYCIFYLFTGQTAQSQTPHLWGTTLDGGGLEDGSIFKINGDGSGYRVEYSFGLYSGINPNGDLIQYSDNNLYGVCEWYGQDQFGVMFSINPVTNTFRDTFNFGGSPPYCYEPVGSLVFTNGLLYGYTLSGNSSYGAGGIYSYNPATNTITPIHNFNGTDGCCPMYGGLMAGSDSSLYGVTPSGGEHDSGVLFNLNLSDNTYKDIFDFGYTYGATPNGKVIEINGTLYGMATDGGKYSDGVIYSYTPSTSTYKDIYDFTGALGENPYGALLNSNGTLYGMTSIGGADNYGVIFSYTISSKTYTVLHNFGMGDGYHPMGSLCLASDGNLYGLTQWGGTYGQGEMFEYNLTTGTFTPVYSFGVSSTDAAIPMADLVEVNNSTTGINTVTENHFSIYPNPTAGNITITAAQNMDEVKVTNLLGQLIYQTYPKQTQTTFDIKDEGMYFVMVTSGNETTTQKLIVTK